MGNHLASELTIPFISIILKSFSLLSVSKPNREVIWEYLFLLPFLLLLSSE